MFQFIKDLPLFFTDKKLLNQDAEVLAKRNRLFGLPPSRLSTKELNGRIYLQGETFFPNDSKEFDKNNSSFVPIKIIEFIAQMAINQPLIWTYAWVRSPIRQLIIDNCPNYIVSHSFDIRDDGYRVSENIVSSTFCKVWSESYFTKQR